jgi:deoxyribose-phosphate aldolase
MQTNPILVHPYIDHTLLKQDATLGQLVTLCNEAKQYQFFSVCIQPHFVTEAKKLLKGSDVKVCTVIGFPLGQHHTNVKVLEAQQALRDGADELDMVINLSLLKDKRYHELYLEIAEIRRISQGKILKVILETCLLTDDEKIKACEIVKEAKADFVKTSTGFATGGATVHDVILMKSVVKDALEVKASGGIRSYEDFYAMIQAGATRIGTSSGVKIIQGLKSDQAY